MSVSLSNSKDLVANAISLIQANGTVKYILDVVGNIEGHLTPEQINKSSDISTALNNDPNLFTTIQNQINNKQDILDNYLPSPITHVLLYNSNYTRTIRCRNGITPFFKNRSGK